MYKGGLKRLIDIALSATGLAILALPMLIIAVIVKMDSKGPVLFWQKRIGLHKKTFMMPKFRTMYAETPANMPTHMLNDPQKWITGCGKFLRKTSLDELPQIWCILTGTMSIIGPRPALWNQYDLIAERDKYGANDILPGLTGWAQINGRDELPIEVKAAYDGEYVNKMSFLFDCKCFIGTIACVLKKEGVVEGGTGTLQKLSGGEH
ncbi:sugar transferase, partial [Cloacibacillus evryensis]|uniref:sugar transferase n=1 Tax=Cloacibacillus evryensis TaxID=508460 RepID=UPI0026DEA5BE